MAVLDFDEFLECLARLGLLRRMDYCAPLLSGRWPVKGSEAQVPTLPIPCDRAVCEEQNVQPGDEEAFVLKVTQLQELFDVRHSVMLIGCAS